MTIKAVKDKMKIIFIFIRQIKLTAKNKKTNENLYSPSLVGYK